VTSPATTVPQVIPDVLHGRVAWIFGDDHDIDLMIGVQNIKYTDPEHLHSVCMKAYEDDFTDKVREGDWLVGGRNFGYGHPHYVAMTAMRNEGIVGVVAESFSPGFWRGEVSNGMPLLTVPGISTAVDRWDDLEVDWRTATVRVPGKELELVGQPLNQRTQDMIAAGGRYALLLAEHGRG
jgi:3-isopropylmalate/(R)-2-methylmalate dehydratase small subunit